MHVFMNSFYTRPIEDYDSLRSKVPWQPASEAKTEDSKKRYVYTTKEHFMIKHTRLVYRERGFHS